MSMTTEDMAENAEGEAVEEAVAKATGKTAARKTALVSGADSRYFPMLLEWVESIRRFPKSREMDICILDAGLTEGQARILGTYGARLTRPEWPASLPESKTSGKEHLKSCVCRPFLNKIFPGYDTYVWLDADTWVQTWEPIDLLIRGAAKSGLAICPQVDRAYGKTARLKWLGPLPFKPRSFYYTNGQQAFSGEIARRLYAYPTLNAGVFSMAGAAPHWDAWQKSIVQALRKGKLFTAEQLTLGMLVHLDGFGAEFLPAWCNWLLETPPVWDKDAQLFVEPYLPNLPIGIMHLSGCDTMRLDRAVMREIKTLDGKRTKISYRYPDFDGEKAAREYEAEI